MPGTECALWARRMCFNMRGSYRCIETPCHLTTNGILCQGMSCLLFPGMLLKILLSLSLTSKPCLQSCFSLTVSNPSGARGLQCVPSSESGQKNEFILRQRLPALSYQSFLAQVCSACNAPRQHLESFLGREHFIG